MSSTPVDVVLYALETAGSSPRRSGDSWTARCPAHDDSTPSLSISEGDDSRVLLHCQAGCTLDAVLSALGLDVADLFPPKQPNPRDGIVAVYDYTDEAGVLLFQVVRKEGHSFFQRRPDGHGGWVNNLGKTPRVLYQLPEVLAAVAARSTVFVAEGEKDVEALRQAGEHATCNPMGAGKWRPEHARALHGAAEVIVVADRDEPGRDHAQKVAASLTGHVDHVVIAEAAAGKDAFDHLGAGRTVDELTVTYDSEDHDPATAPGDADSDGWLAPLDWQQFWTKEDHVNEWAIEPIVPAGRQVSVWARAKVGKSLLALDCAAAAATGASILGQPRRDPIDVVYLDLEMTADDLRERLTDLGYGPDTNLGRLHYYFGPVPPLDGPVGGEWAAAVCSRWKAALFVVDTMARAVTGDENSSDTYRNFQAHTGAALRRAGCAVWINDHGGKDARQGQRGSSAKEDGVDVVYQLSATGGEFMVLRRTHSRVAWVPPEIVVQRREDNLLRHVLADVAYPEGTADCAADLDGLEVPLDASVRTAMQSLRGVGKGRRQDVVTAALKYRRRPR